MRYGCRRYLANGGRPLHAGHAVARDLGMLFCCARLQELLDDGLPTRTARLLMFAWAWRRVY